MSKKPSGKKFLFVLILLHLAVVLPLAYWLNVWKDEASTLYTTQHGFLYALTNAVTDERQAPLYFILMSVWRLADDSVFWARLFSVLCGALAVGFFYDSARRFLDARAAQFICAVFAIHPFLIWAGVEIRGYSLLILLSVLLLKFFAEGYLEFEKPGMERETEAIPEISSSRRRRQQIFYVVTAAIGLYTNYYLGFLLAAGFAALLVLRRFRTALTYFRQMLVVGVFSLPLVWIIKRQFSINTGGFVEPVSLAAGLEILAGYIREFIYPMGLAPDGTLSVISLFRLVFLWSAGAALVFFLLKNRLRAAADEKVLATGAFVAVVSAFLLAACLALGMKYTVARHFTVLFAPLILFLGVFSRKVLPPKIWLVAAALFALLFPYSKIYKQFPNFAKHGDWARVARFIEQNEKPNQPIIVFPAFDALSPAFHYRGVNKILPDERFFEWNHEDSPASENAFRKQIEFVISEIPPEADEIWVATEEVCQFAPTERSCAPLENFLEAHYTVEKQEDFYMERVRLFKKKRANND
jgi:hypothetical protein